MHTGDMPLLALQQATCVFDHKTVLDAVSLTISQGTVTTIVGPNGGGKSTLLGCMVGTIIPNRGTVNRQSHIRLSYVPQQAVPNRLLPMTVRRFAALCESTIDNTLAETLGIARLFDDSVHTLSGGEWRRVLLAVALARSVDVLLLDEPAQGLDINAQSVLYGLIEEKRIREKTAVVIVSHDLHVVMQTSDCVFCVNRHICCSGTPDEIRLHPEYNTLFQAGLAHDTIGVYRHSHDHIHTDAIG